uniref:Putative secreted protein n=1 Tax=Ixodes ricinus TaxID=34613 RepID=A0A6B0UIL4_IXORI
MISISFFAIFWKRFCAGAVVWMSARYTTIFLSFKSVHNFIHCFWSTKCKGQAAVNVFIVEPTGKFRSALPFNGVHLANFWYSCCPFPFGRTERYHNEDTDEFYLH